MRVRPYWWLFLGHVGIVACGGAGAASGPSPLPPVAMATPAPVSTPVPAATPAPAEPSPPPATPSEDTTAIRHASIQGANGHGASGSARILKTGNSYVLELGSNFRIDSGATDVYLTRSSSTTDARDLNLGALRELSGRQQYDMPDDGGRYEYVMLWCRPFRVPIGVGRLE